MTRKGWSDNKWPQPVLSERVQPDEILMTLSVENGGADFGKGQNVTKDVTKDVAKELTERQKIIIEMITLEPTLTAKSISEKTSEKIDVTDRTIENDFAQLKKMGILTCEGGRNICSVISNPLPYLDFVGQMQYQTIG